MLLAHKIELRPTPEQMVYLDKACGSKRHCYNQLLAHFAKPENKWSKNKAYQYYINVIRKEFEWYNEVSSRVTRNAIDDLDSAFKHFFRRVKAKQKAGFPRFKKKDIKDSFALRESAKFDVHGRELRIEKIKTKIELRQPLRFSGVAKQVTISKRAGKYFASILVETNDYNPNDVDRQKSVGVDFVG
jgi:putative transposase